MTCHVCSRMCSSMLSCCRLHSPLAAVRGPEWWISEAVHWRDVTYRESMRAMLWLESDPDRHRLGRGIRGCTTRRWDDPLQAHRNAKGFQDTPWQTVAQNKDEWQASAHTFAQVHLGRKTHAQVHNGCWMIGETP